MIFKEGQEVMCISDNFPVIKEYGGLQEETKITPHIGEILLVDEILGEFLRFEKYDTDESWNWWISKNFKPLDEISDVMVEKRYLETKQI